MLRSRTLGIISTPPKFSSGLVVSDNVSNIQDYDASTGSFIGEGTYMPDYTKVPLTIDPVIGILYSDRPLTNINGRTMLTNIHWYQLSDAGVKTEIVISGGTSTPIGYTLLDNTEGSETAGRLQVAKNATPLHPIQLLFEADVFTGNDTFHVREVISIVCRDVTPFVLCSFDLPDVVPYNPLREGNLMPITLRVMENRHQADEAHFIPVWEVRRDDGTWSEYGEEVTDYWLEIASDGMSAILDRELMAEGVSIRVRLKYERNGNPGEVTLTDEDKSVPMCRVEVKLQPRFDYKVINLTNQLPGWATAICPEVVIEDGIGGLIDDPDKFFKVKMYACPANRALTDSDLVGEGRVQQIPCNGQSIKFAESVEFREPYKAWEDSDGKVLTDSDGKILLIR